MKIFILFITVFLFSCNAEPPINNSSQDVYRGGGWIKAERRGNQWVIRKTEDGENWAELFVADTSIAQVYGFEN